MLFHRRGLERRHKLNYALQLDVGTAEDDLVHMFDADNVLQVLRVERGMVSDE